MDNLTTQTRLFPYALALLTVVGAAVGFVVIGPILGFFLALPFYSGSAMDLIEAIQHPVGNEAVKTPLYVMQASATFFGLTLFPLLLWLAAERRTFSSWFSTGKVHLQMLLVVFILVISFMATNSVFIDWNAHVSFPEALKGFEEWAREREDLAESVTKFLTQFSGADELAVGFLVIAVLPAIGEELVFRGMLQPQLYRSCNNIHVAIWTSAILFSAFHLQFFGFVPRMLLGALFGYLYYWSGNLLMPMFAHFVNNGFSVLMLYLRQQGTVEMDVEAPEAAPWQAVAGFTILVIGLLFYYKRFFEREREHG